MSSALTRNPEVTLIVVAVSGLALWLLLRGFGGVAKDASKATVAVASGVVGGVVEGVGEIVGIPATSMSQCEIDIANKDYFGASVSCPASRFLKFAATGK